MECNVADLIRPGNMQLLSLQKVTEYRFESIDCKYENATFTWSEISE